MSTHGRQTSQITPNWNQIPLTTFWELFKYPSFKLLSGIIFLSLPSQSVIPCYIIVSLQLTEYLWQTNISNYSKFKIKTSIYVPRYFAKNVAKICCVTSFFLSFLANPSGQFAISWVPHSNHSKLKQKSSLSKSLL